MKFTLATGCGRGLCRNSCSRSDRQLNVYDWLADVPGNAESTDLVEVQFKNTRKGYYHNVNGLDLKKGDWVAVEANPGHDIGIVTLTGRLAALQVKKANLKSADDIRRIYRFAKDTDKSIEQMARVLKTFINSTLKPIKDIQPNDIRAYLFNYQRDRGISNRSLDFLRTIICTFFKWCSTEGYIPTNPAANIRPIKYTRKPRKALSQIELERVRRACHTERDLCIVETLYSTGCRVSELCNIRLSDIDWQNHEIVVLGKGNKYRTVYINAKAEIAMKAYLGVRKHSSEWLVCNDRGGGQMTPANIQRIFSKIEEETGIRR